MALRFASYGYILENGRVVLDGEAEALRQNEDVKEFYLGVRRGQAQVVPRREALQAAQALARLMIAGAERQVTPSAVRQRPITDFSALETRDPAQREHELFRLCPSRSRMREGARFAKARRRRSERDHFARGAPSCPVIRKSELMERQKEQSAPFGGFNVARRGRLRRLFTSPGPIYDPEGHAPRLAARRARCTPPASAAATSCTTRSPTISAGGLDPRSRRVRARLPGDSRRHRQYRAAGRRYRPRQAGAISARRTSSRSPVDKAEKTDKDASSLSCARLRRGAAGRCARAWPAGRRRLQCYATPISAWSATKRCARRPDRRTRPDRRDRPPRHRRSGRRRRGRRVVVTCSTRTIR